MDETDYRYESWLEKFFWQINNLNKSYRIHFRLLYIRFPIDLYKSYKLIKKGLWVTPYLHDYVKIIVCND